MSKSFQNKKLCIFKIVKLIPHERHASWFDNSMFHHKKYLNIYYYCITRGEIFLLEIN